MEICIYCNKKITKTGDKVETHIDNDYKYKLKVLLKRNQENLIKRGFYEFNSRMNKFDNRSPFLEDYYKKKYELSRKLIYKQK